MAFPPVLHKMSDKQKSELPQPTPERAAVTALRDLARDEYRLWDDFVDASPQGSLFCYSWWLQAIGGDVRVLGYFENNRLVAGIPLFFDKQYGLRVCTMPKATQTWGVIMEPFLGKRANALSREMQILKIFAQYLTRETIFYQQFHPNLQNWLPFYWNGFRQVSMCTYVLEDLTDLDQTWEGMAQNIRTKIRKAEKLGIIVIPCNIDLVFDAEVKTFSRQKKSLPRYRRGQLERLYMSAKEHNAGECFAAKDPDGRVHAAAFVVWNHKRAYYLAGGGDSSLRSSGAQSLLAWHSIRFVAQRTRVFDFCGSVVEPIEQFVRGFGTKQVPYSRIMRFPIWLNILLSVAGKV